MITLVPDSLLEDFNVLAEDMPELAKLLCADESDNPYGISMVHLASIMLVFHACKDEQYGRSWAKRGEVGVFHNFMRKEDRLDQLAMVSMLGEDPEHDVALIDTLLDRALYGMMYVAYIAKARPHAFQAWLERSWCKTTGIPFSDIMALLDVGE